VAPPSRPGAGAGARRGAVAEPRFRRAAVPLLAAAAVVVVATILAFTLHGPRAAFTYDDPFDAFSPGPGTAQASDAQVDGAPDPEAGLARFLTFVVSDVQRFWKGEFERARTRYVPADVVVFRHAAQSGCGPASAVTGPFYCPLDRTVYLEGGFFSELATFFRAPGDFADAYVIAHELGHHVQTLSGITPQVDRAMAEDPTNRNELSILLELQADCLAGVWGHSTYDRGLLERGDLDEALRAAAAVGDDRIQARTTGRIDPETWTHGSSAQRRAWYLRGFDAGEPGACDTFSASEA
jgi:predicted metalloprotease